MNICLKNLVRLASCCVFACLASCVSYNQLSFLNTDTITSLTGLIAQSPNDAKAYNLRAIAYANMQRLAPAIADFKTAIKLNPSYYQAYANLGLVYYNSRQLNDAYLAYNNALHLLPTYDQALIGLGNIFRLKHKIDLAILYYTKAIQANTTDSAAWYYLGIIRQDESKYELSIDLFGKGISHSPDNFQLYNARGISYLALNQLDSALADFEAAYRLKPSDAQNLASMGVVYEMQHNPSLAYKYYRQALALSPNLRTARGGLERLS